MKHEFCKIKSREDHYLVASFLQSAGDSLNSFRYFKMRSLDVIENHLVTLLLMIKNQPAGYGHLDQKDNTVWLGLCISEAHRGQGLGQIMLQKLLACAKELSVPEIYLSVDETNFNAIKLYSNYAFSLVRKDGEIEFYHWIQSEK